MRRALVPLSVVAVLLLGLLAAGRLLTVAQDASPPAGTGEAADVCPAAGTPEASPGASPEASPTGGALGTPAAAAGGSPPASPGAEAECRVDIVDYAFTPATIEVAVGTTVTWVNHDGPDRRGAHTATADDGTFDSGELDQGGTFSHTFDRPGEYGYFCRSHPEMTGTVIVR